MTLSPKLVRQTWENVYAGRYVVTQYKSRGEAELFASDDDPSIGILRRDFYDDGTCVPVLEDV